MMTASDWSIHSCDVGSMSRLPRILLSDDDAAFADAVREGLGRFGFDVTVANDGRAAIGMWDDSDSVASDAANVANAANVDGVADPIANSVPIHDAVPFHLCLLDFHMPGATGLDVIRHVRSRPGGTVTPCVLMSAAMDDSIRREAESMRTYRILDKPIRLGILGQVVRDAITETYGWTA